MVWRYERALELGKEPSARGWLDTAAAEHFLSARYLSAERDWLCAADAHGTEAGRLFAGVVQLSGESTSHRGRSALRRGNRISGARAITTGLCRNANLAGNGTPSRLRAVCSVSISTESVFARASLLWRFAKLGRLQPRHGCNRNSHG